jgi:hypothetical protein
VCRDKREGLTCPLAGSREGTGGAATLLEMEAAAATPHAEGVGLVPPLSETPCSLSLYRIKHAQISEHIDRDSLCTCRLVSRSREMAYHWSRCRNPSRVGGSAA